MFRPRFSTLFAAAFVLTALVFTFTGTVKADEADRIAAREVRGIRGEPPAAVAARRANYARDVRTCLQPRQIAVTDDGYEPVMAVVTTWKNGGCVADELDIHAGLVQDYYGWLILDHECETLDTNPAACDKIQYEGRNARYGGDHSQVAEIGRLRHTPGAIRDLQAASTRSGRRTDNLETAVIGTVRTKRECHGVLEADGRTPAVNPNGTPKTRCEDVPLVDETSGEYLRNNNGLSDQMATIKDDITDLQGNGRTTLRVGVGILGLRQNAEVDGKLTVRPGNPILGVLNVGVVRETGSTETSASLEVGLTNSAFLVGGNIAALRNVGRLFQIGGYVGGSYVAYYNPDGEVCSSGGHISLGPEGSVLLTPHSKKVKIRGTVGLGLNAQFVGFPELTFRQGVGAEIFTGFGITR